MNNKFNFYEIVQICSSEQTLIEVNGCKGVILGMSQCENTGKWGYAVSVYTDDGFVWDIMEENLISTGNFTDPDEFSTSESIKVHVDPKTGKGNVVKDD